MTRLVVKNQVRRNESIYDEIGLPGQNKDIVLGLVLNTIGRDYVITWGEEGIVSLTFFNFCIPTLIKYSNDNPHDWQLLARWDN